MIEERRVRQPVSSRFPEQMLVAITEGVEELGHDRILSAQSSAKRTLPDALRWTIARRKITTFIYRFGTR